MARSTLNFVIDVVTFIVMLTMIATGLLIRFVLPPGSGERRTLWDYTRHGWGDVHFWLAVALGGLVLVHLALHWSWVCGLVSRWCAGADAHGHPKSALRRNLVGAALLLAVTGLIGGFLWIAQRSVVGIEGGGGQHRGSRNAALFESPARANEASPETSVTSAATELEIRDGIRVYYFHRTLRCQTCLKIEALSRQVIEENFGAGLADGRMTWQAVNIEVEGNEHFERDFSLQTQSLILAEYSGNRCVRWKLLPDVWDLVGNEPAFTDYVCRELYEFGGG